jgi:hypothetical protein
MPTLISSRTLNSVFDLCFQQHGARLEGVGDGDPNAPRFMMVNDVERECRKFRTVARDVTLRFQIPERDHVGELYDELQLAMNEVLEELTRDADPQDMVRLTLSHPSLNNEIWIPFMRADELTADIVMEQIAKVLQSNEHFTIDVNIIIHFIHVRMPVGGRNNDKPHINFEKWMDSKDCFITIKNGDNLCCARAIVLGMAREDELPRKDKKQWDKLRIDSGKLQGRKASRLHANADVNPGPCGRPEWVKFQTYLQPTYQLFVLSKYNFNGIIYQGPVKAQKKIYLYHHDNHYSLITKMKSFVNNSYYCTECNKGYDHKEKHKCLQVCPSCNRENVTFINGSNVLIAVGGFEVANVLRRTGYRVKTRSSKTITGQSGWYLVKVCVKN